MTAPTVVKLGIPVAAGLELYLVVTPDGQRASLIRVAAANIVVVDVQDLSKKGT